MICDSILKDGIFDTLVVDHSKTTSEDLFEWLKTMEWSQVKEKVDAGLKIGLPIEGIPLDIGAAFTEDDFNEWKKEVDAGRSRKFTDAETMNIVSSNASEVIANAWLDCMAKVLGVGRTGLVTSIEGVPGSPDLIFTVRFLPNTITDLPPDIVSPGLVVAGANAVNPPAVGAEVPFAGYSVLLRRNPMEAVTVVLNTTKGTATGTMPAPEPPTPKQTDLYLSKDTDGTRYTLRIKNQNGESRALDLIDSVKYNVSYHWKATIRLPWGKPFSVDGDKSIDIYSSDAGANWAATYVEDDKKDWEVEVTALKAFAMLKDGRTWEYSASP